MLSRPLSFRAGDLETPLQARTDETEDVTALSNIARRDLERYYAMLALSLPRFSEGEGSLIVDALNGTLNGTLTEAHTASLLWAQISDALDDGLAEKWHVDGPALVERLRRLTPFEALAVADASNRFWVSVVRDGEMSHADRLRMVGLLAGAQ